MENEELLNIVDETVLLAETYKNQADLQEMNDVKDDRKINENIYFGIAIYPYEARDEDELGFLKDELLQLLSKIGKLINSAM